MLASEASAMSFARGIITDPVIDVGLHLWALAVGLGRYRLTKRYRKIHEIRPLAPLPYSGIASKLTTMRVLRTRSLFYLIIYYHFILYCQIGLPISRITPKA